MTKTTCFLSYIGVLGAGVGIGVLGTKVYFEKQANDRVDSEIEQMRAYYESLKPEPEKEEEVVEENRESLADISTFRDYNTLSEHIAYNEMDEKPESPKEEYDDEPYFIDIDDFDEVTLGYAKKELVYYMDDGSLVNEQDNTEDDGEVVSIVDTVGVKNLEEFENSYETTCYIRNEKLKEDYEVSKIFNSYGAVLGDV